MSSFTIGNGCNVPVNQQTGTVPNMGSTILDWMQLLTFGLVTKVLQGFQVSETVTNISFYGIVQPLTGRELLMKEEGQRKWNWIQVHAQALPNSAIFNLGIDDTVLFNSKQYRVAKRMDYAIYSYIYYELVEDYTDVGPTPVETTA